MARTPGLIEQLAKQGEVKKALQRQKEEIFPIYQKNGQFICFVEIGTYAMTQVILGNDPGTYIDEHNHALLETNPSAFDIEMYLSGVLSERLDESSDVTEEEERQKILAVMLKLHKNMHHSKEAQIKYPRSFFSKLYPYG